MYFTRGFRIDSLPQNPKTPRTTFKVNIYVRCILEFASQIIDCADAVCILSSASAFLAATHVLKALMKSTHDSSLPSLF